MARSCQRRIGQRRSARGNKRRNSNSSSFKAAKALGFVISHNFLLDADEVIE
jgi:hypothetical protein